MKKDDSSAYINFLTSQSVLPSIIQKSNTFRDESPGVETETEINKIKTINATTKSFL